MCIVATQEIRDVVILDYSRMHIPWQLPILTLRISMQSTSLDTGISSLFEAPLLYLAFCFSTGEHDVYVLSRSKLRSVVLDEIGVRKS